MRKRNRGFRLVLAAVIMGICCCQSILVEAVSSSEEQIENQKREEKNPGEENLNPAVSEVTALLLQEKLFQEQAEEEAIRFQNLLETTTEEENGQFYFLLKYRMLTEIATKPKAVEGHTENSESDMADLLRRLEVQHQVLEALTEKTESLWGKKELVETIRGEAFEVFYSEYVMPSELPAELKNCSETEAYEDTLQSLSEDIKEIEEAFQKIETTSSQNKMELVQEILQRMGAAYQVILQKNPHVQSQETETQEELNGKKEQEVPKENSTTKGRMANVGKRAPAVARVGNQYYSDFNEAFWAMPDGGTIYVLRNCMVRHITTKKSFSIYPEGANVTMTFDEDTIYPAGIICTEDGWHGNPTWNLGGKDGYSLTLNANGRGYSGVIATYGATINLKSGVRLTNSSGNGVWNHAGTTNVEDGVQIDNNQAHGIATFATINLYGGEIYGNTYDGVRAQTAINMSGGSIHHNGHCGVHVGEGRCSFEMSGGSISQNVYGVGNFNGQGEIRIRAGEIYGNYNYGVATWAELLDISGSTVIRDNTGTGVAAYAGEASIKGGKIYGNTVSGIVNETTMRISGGDIFSNRNGGEGGGIQNHGNLSITGGSIRSNTAGYGGGVSSKNEVFVAGGAITGNTASHAGGGIYLPKGTLEMTGGDVSQNTAPLGSGLYYNGSKFTMKQSGAIHTGNEVYLEQNKYIQITGPLNAETAAIVAIPDYGNGRKVAEVAYGAQKGSMQYQKYKLKPYEKFCLRPVDYQDKAGQTKAPDIVVSTRYTISYDKNLAEEVLNLPANGEKYWQEAVMISTQKPSAGLIRFWGWEENPSAETPTLFPGNALHLSWNRDVKLYAVWGPQIRIIYKGNGSDPKQEQAEKTTILQCMKNKGYTVRKNKEFTQFTRKGYQFAGWDIKEGVFPKEAKYKEGIVNKITAKNLLDIAAEQNGGLVSENVKVQDVYLYAIWDKAPVIQADSIQEYFEGTKVTGEMLLQNVKAEDEEDGTLTTTSLRIIGIEYAAGKIVDGQKQGGSSKSWLPGMTTTEQLDTWFLQMDKQDSPITHTIIYEVRDSAGNETKLRWPARVKYNEFPVIEAEDHFFTLEEAKQGLITEELLLKEALNNEKLKVTDLEDDQLHPGSMADKIEILNFQEDEFLRFQNSGYVVITYAVQDSMGPEGKGKETQRQCTVHVVKDGEVVEPEEVRYVRFISKKYYDKKNEAGQGGGLREDSKWNLLPDYQNLISGIWSSEENAKEEWEFLGKDVAKLRTYVDQYGIGNSSRDDGLTGFLQKFGALKVK